MSLRDNGTRFLSLLLGPAVLLVALSDVGWGQSEPTIVRVEEDWEMVVGEPDPDTSAPQVTCVISACGDVESVHAVFELNQQSLPAFTPGGLQLQLWDGEAPLCDRKFPSYAVLAQPGETIRWTQSVELDDGKLTFEIKDGSSATWGGFGGQGYLKAVVDTALTSLNDYRPQITANNSGINYAENRVESLILKRVRAYTSTGEMIEHDTATVVHALE